MIDIFDGKHYLITSALSTFSIGEKHIFSGIYNEEGLLKYAKDEGIKEIDIDEIIKKLQDKLWVGIQKIEKDKHYNTGRLILEVR